LCSEGSMIFTSMKAFDSRPSCIKKSSWLDTLEAVVEALNSSEWGNERRDTTCKDNTTVEYCSQAEGNTEEAKVNSSLLDEIHASQRHLGLFLTDDVRLLQNW
jgi:hypothetical protein